MELYSWAWLYFVSFVLLGTFVVFNMLIGIILNSMEEARITIHMERDSQPIREIRDQLKVIRDTLEMVEKQIEQELKRHHE